MKSLHSASDNRQPVKIGWAFKILQSHSISLCVFHKYLPTKAGAEQSIFYASTYETINIDGIFNQGMWGRLLKIKSLDENFFGVVWKAGLIALRLCGPQWFWATPLTRCKPRCWSIYELWLVGCWPCHGATLSKSNIPGSVMAKQNRKNTCHPNHSTK